MFFLKQGSCAPSGIQKRDSSLREPPPYTSYAPQRVQSTNIVECRVSIFRNCYYDLGKYPPFPVPRTLWGTKDPASCGFH